MRGLLSWLVMFGVIAGLGSRVLALDHLHPKPDAVHACGHDHCHDHGHEPTDDHSHDDGPPGPHEHHHTHACCQPSPLAGAEIQPQRLRTPEAVRLCVSWLAALPPDEPVFALDKPPLI